MLTIRVAVNLHGPFSNARARKSARQKMGAHQPEVNRELFQTIAAKDYDIRMLPINGNEILMNGKFKLPINSRSWGIIVWSVRGLTFIRGDKNRYFSRTF